MTRGPGPQRRRSADPTNPTDDEWERVRLLLPPVSKHGRKLEEDMHEMLNAIHYMVHGINGR